MAKIHISQDQQQDQQEEKLLNIQLPKTPRVGFERRLGLGVVLLFLALFFAWAYLAPIESAAIATGKIALAGKRRIIQHLEGGIVKKIFVKEDQKVKKDQKLLQLDITRPQVALELVRNEFYELTAIKARLEAEVRNQEAVHFPAVLQKIKNVQVSKLIKDQRNIFLAKRKALQGQVDILKQRAAQLSEESKGTQAQIKSFTDQLTLITKEAEETKILYEKNLIERSRYLNLLREKARLQGQRGNNIAKLASIKQKIGETKLQINTTLDDNQKELLKELRETQLKLSEITEKEKAANDQFTRTTIRAPQTGAVIDLRVHTIGQVVKPGEILMEIVPKDDKLVIDAEINPLDIDVVHPGLVAKVQMSALQTRTTPTLLGKVTHVSADAFQDEKNRRTYYRATVTINAEELKKLGAQRLYPGMPAEVMIITNKLTPWGYFLGPITRSFHRAFREQ